MQRLAKTKAFSPFIWFDKPALSEVEGLTMSGEEYEPALTLPGLEDEGSREMSGTLPPLVWFDKLTTSGG